MDSRPALASYAPSTSRDGRRALAAERSPLPPPLSTSVPRRTRRRRRFGASKLAYTVALVLPHVVAATPLLMPPYDTGTPRRRLSPPYSLEIAGRAFDAIVASRDLIMPTPRTMQFLKRSMDGMYHVPDNMVILRRHFKWYLIVVAYVIAFIGSMVTLELLIRRTTTRGTRNVILLLLAGFTFGAVSTFSMHFIFNNSLSLHHPLESQNHYPAIYLSYDWGYSILSLVASWAAMTTAFFIMAFDFTWLDLRRAFGFTTAHRQKDPADEYKRWKKANKVNGRRGTSAGALLRKAGALAPWTLLDSDTNDRSGWNGGKADGPEWDDRKRSIVHDGQDKSLAELDFRLGHSAVQVELARRERMSSLRSATQIDNPLLTPTPHLDATVRPMYSDSSFTSAPVVTPSPTPLDIQPARRGSVPENKFPAPLFNPSFGFPSLATDDAPRSAPPDTPTHPFDEPGPLDIPAAAAVGRRRASLPVSSIGVPATTLRPLPLTRIQSLPEPDVDIEMLEKSGTVPSESGDNNTTSHSPSESNDGKFETMEQTFERHVKIKRNHHRFLNQIERFLGFDVVTRWDILKILTCGIIAGWGVAGMHYIGQCSIVGMPYIAYKPQFVVGSVIIASGAVCIALYIMFVMLRPKLKHTWISKLGVATILAAAVCFMHFTGMMGTIYGWPAGTRISHKSVLTGVNAGIVGIVIALACVTCLAGIGFIVVDSWRSKRERERRRRVVVASVCIDENDRILVGSLDGLLPMCDIANLSPEPQKLNSKRSVKTSWTTWSNDTTVLGMDLTTGHDAFVQAAKLSWSWKNGSPFSLPVAPSASEEERRGSSATMTSYTQTLSTFSQSPSRGSINKFLEKFAQAASDLAVKVIGRRDGISRVGVLYDQVLSTGWVKLDHSADTVSKGQLVFLVRRVTSGAERSDLVSRSFIFADATAVALSLSKQLSVSNDDVLPLLNGMKVFSNETMNNTLKPATLYAGVAVVQATPFDGLRILLEEKNRSQLPMRQLCPLIHATSSAISEDAAFGTAEEIGEILSWMEGMKLLSIIQHNMTSEGHEGEQSFFGLPLALQARMSKLLQAIEHAIVPMLDGMLSPEDMEHILPRLTLHPALVPLTPGQSRKLSGYIPPYLVVFYANYDAAVNTFTEKWLPFSLFRAQNACVMAPRINAVTRAEQAAGGGLGGADDLDLDLSGTYTRRPSKVQFEFPPQQSGDKPDATTVMTSTFGTYSFPPTAPVVNPAHVGPRRSSLASRSRFNSLSHDGVLGEPYHPGVGRTWERTPGVAIWDPEWLLVLLRTKLHADM